MHAAAGSVEKRLAARLSDLERRRTEIEHFVMTLCHELRTPLNGMLGMLQLMQHSLIAESSCVGKLGSLEARLVEEVGGGAPATAGLIREMMVARHGMDDRLAAQLRKLMSASELQLAVVEDLLDFTRAQTGVGAEVAAGSRFTLADVCGEALDVVRAALPRDEAEFDSTVTVFWSAEGEFVGDRRRILQILLNVLSNAFKATVRGSVTVTAKANRPTVLDAREGHCELLLEVADTGVGMAAEVLEAHMCGGPFKVVGSSASSGVGGVGGGGTKAGLGFGIARHTIEHTLGGRVVARSKEGEGTTIGVIIPLKMSGGAAAAAAAPCKTRLSREAGAGGAGGSGPSPILPCRLEAAGSASGLPTQHSILVVDDNHLNREVLVGLLAALEQSEGVDQAADGCEALALMERRFDAGIGPYAEVFMDVNMPNLCGDDATEELRRREAADGRARTHVLGLSAFCVSETRERCLRKGMDDYATKPMMMATLRGLLGKIEARAVGAPAMPLFGSPPCLSPPLQSSAPSSSAASPPCLRLDSSLFFTSSPPSQSSTSSVVSATSSWKGTSSPLAMRPLFDIADHAGGKDGKDRDPRKSLFVAGAWSRPSLPPATADAGNTMVATCAPLPEGMRGADAEVLDAEAMWIGCGCNHEVVRTYLRQAQSAGDVEATREQVERRDYEEVRKLAHKVRGRVAYLYASLSMDALKQLHRAARAAHSAPSDDAHACVVDAFSHVEAEIARLDATIRRLCVCDVM